jgi:hypothetical protein
MNSNSLPTSGDPTMTDKTNAQIANFVSVLAPASKELGKPIEASDIIKRYTGYNIARHPYIKDGILCKPTFPQQTIDVIAKTIFTAVDRVKDEHFPQMGFLAASFLRLLAFSTTDKAIQVDLYFRFTTDQCPAGERSFVKIRHEVTNALVNDLKLEASQFILNVEHGGTPHQIDDINDPAFRAMFKTIMQGCDPQCAELKKQLLVNLGLKKNKLE